MKYYVAYGSNLSVEQMARRCPDATIVGTGVLKNWRLVFRTHATIDQCKGFSVPVLVWAISERDEARLDRYEGYPRYYVKEYISVPVTTTTGRFSARAMVYLMAEGSPIQRPSEGYFQTIKGGYEQLGFDLHVLHDALEDSWYYEGFLAQE